MYALCQRRLLGLKNLKKSRWINIQLTNCANRVIRSLNQRPGLHCNVLLETARLEILRGNFLSFLPVLQLSPCLLSRHCGTIPTHGVSKGNFTNKIVNVTNINEQAEECYQNAMNALSNAVRAKELQEEHLMREQYDAMNNFRLRRQHKLQRQEENNQNIQNINDIVLDRVKDRTAGVAVIKTIVKQSQREMAKANQHVCNNDKRKKENADRHCDDENRWEKMAREYLEEAAYKYGHPKALVRLGNEALEQSNLESTSSTDLPVFNIERCRNWLEESPINLKKLFFLATRLDTSSRQIDDEDFNSCDENFLSYHQQIAAHLYEEAGKQGSREGWYNLGYLLWDVLENYKLNDDNIALINFFRRKSFEAFYMAIELGDADAMYFVAIQLLSSQDNSDKKEELFYAILSEQSDRIKECIRSFNHVENDLFHQRQQQQLTFQNNLHQTGYYLLCNAAHCYTHGPSMYHLALLHHQTNENCVEFRKLLTEAAATNHPESLFLQGHCFYHGSDGYGPKADYVAALKNFLAAAQCGHSDAMVSAGAMLHHGVRSDDGKLVIIKQDQQRAFQLYQQAGEMGSVEGWRNVVACYATGEGVPKCLETAEYIAKTMLKEESEAKH